MGEFLDIHKFIDDIKKDPKSSIPYLIILAVAIAIIVMMKIYGVIIVSFLLMLIAPMFGYFKLTVLFGYVILRCAYILSDKDQEPLLILGLICMLIFTAIVFSIKK